MNSLNGIWARMRLEMFLGHSHQCHNCKSTFLAHEDGCPNCGAGAMTSLLHHLELSDVKESNDKFTYFMVCGDDGVYVHVGSGEFSPWPKV